MDYFEGGGDGEAELRDQPQDENSHLPYEQDFFQQMQGVFVEQHQLLFSRIYYKEALPSFQPQLESNGSSYRTSALLQDEAASMQHFCE